MTADSHPLTPGIATAVLIALLVLVAATIGAAYLDLGRLNIVITLAIAALKSLLVMAFFMHLWRSHRLNWFVALFGFAFVALLVGGVVVDFMLR